MKNSRQKKTSGSSDDSMDCGGAELKERLEKQLEIAGLTDRRARCGQLV